MNITTITLRYPNNPLIDTHRYFVVDRAAWTLDGLAPIIYIYMNRKNKRTALLVVLQFLEFVYFQSRPNCQFDLDDSCDDVVDDRYEARSIKKC